MNPLCPLCKSRDARLFGQAGRVVLYRCPCCGLVFKPTESLDRADVQELQDGVYQDLRLRSEVKILHRMAEDRLGDLMTFKPGKKILEIGCATGEFLEAARDRGFAPTGIDASKLFADFAKSKGLNVRNGLVEDVLSKDETFDAVVLFHLIEHIPDPTPFLAGLRNHLAEGGLLFIVCPNLDSRSRKIFGWWHSNYQQPDHLTFFSEKTLSDLVNRAGFAIQSTFTREYPHSYFTSLRGYLALRIGEWKKGRRQLSPGTSTPASKTSPKAPGPRSMIKYLYRKLPYWLGALFSPVLRPLGRRLERKMEGHELCLIAKKSDLSNRTESPI